LHFAVYRSPDKGGNPRVYVLDPNWLNESLGRRKSYGKAKKDWEREHKADAELKDEWDRIYLFDDKSGWKRTPLPSAPLVLDFYNITRRVAAQRSRFIVLGKERDRLRALLHKRNVRLTYVDIEPEKIPQIKRQLEDAGITESVIFPDLDGVGREINQRWKYRKLLGRKDTRRIAPE
jgi:hypothetical protein